MTSLPRSLLKRFRSLCRRGGLHKFGRGGGGPVITLVGDADGLRIGCQSPGWRSSTGSRGRVMQ